MYKTRVQSRVHWHANANVTVFQLGRGRCELWMLILPPVFPPAQVILLFRLCPHLHPPLSAVHNGPSPGRKQAFTYRKPWGNPYQSSGLTFSSAQNTKTMQICPACVYLPSVSVCTTGTSIVPCVAIIACNLHRIRTGSSALISNNAGKSLHRLRSYLTAQQNYRFSCGVLNLQGVFSFSCCISAVQGTLSAPNVACLSALFVL